MVLLSLDAKELVKLVKQAAVDANEANGPVRVCYGVVTSAAPLEISVDQKLILKSGQLILTNNVRDYNVDMTVEHQTEVADGHIHAYKGKKTFKVHLALKTGEKVILLRCDGGQKYVVLDRWEAP